MLLKIFLVSAAIFGVSQGGVTLGRNERKGQVAVNPYLMGGDVVSDRFYPSMVSLKYNTKHICGGVILNENWILTAAQCVENRMPSSISAIVGSNLLNSGDSHMLREIKIHEAYNATSSWRNDIALLRVQQPIKITWGTLAANLPPKGYTAKLGTEGIAVGWGSTQAGGQLSSELRYLQLKIGDTNRCNSTYHEFHLNVYSNQFCDLGQDGRGTCDGDMGGPFFIDDQVYGIISWGRPCGYSGYPTVYTKVSEYIDWINVFIHQM